MRRNDLQTDPVLHQQSLLAVDPLSDEFKHRAMIMVVELADYDPVLSAEILEMLGLKEVNLT